MSFNQDSGINKESMNLDPVELAVLKDRDFLPIKQLVCTKIETWLMDLSKELGPMVKAGAAYLPKEVCDSSPKISRGENYHSYAYRVLDYPRFFSGQDMFTFRTVVLWGHPIGFHLMLAGRPRVDYLPKLLEGLLSLPKGYYLSAQDQPWIWESTEEGLMPIHQATGASIAKALQERTFAKVSYFLPLDEHPILAKVGKMVWQELLKILV